MSNARISLLAALLAAVPSMAIALPFDGSAFAQTHVVPTLAQYGYGYVYGGRAYGRFYRRRLSDGTGYRGRGTRTGGPVGGLPNRN